MWTFPSRTRKPSHDSALGMSFVQVARLSSHSLCITQQCRVGLGLRSNRIFRNLWDLWQLHVFIIEYLVKIHIYTPLCSFCACLFLVAPRLHTSYSHLVDHRLIDFHSPKLLSSESDHSAIRNESVTGRFRSDNLEKLSKASIPVLIPILTFFLDDCRKVDVTVTLCHRNWFCPTHPHVSVQLLLLIYLHSTIPRPPKGSVKKKIAASDGVSTSYVPVSIPSFGGEKKSWPI